MPVFFLPPDLITPPIVTITGELLTHIRDSLRMTVGERLLIADGQGRRYCTEVTAVAKQAVVARILEAVPAPVALAPSLTLAQALLKGEKMDWVIQKATELGVASIVPLQCRHSMVQPKPDRIEGQTARWQRIALEAAQQSEQWLVPTVMPPQTMERFSNSVPASALRLILMERRETAMNLSAIALPASPQDSITLFIGPEGGWAREETAEAETRGLVPITLGPAILRAETAAVVAVGILQHRLGRLG
jgi:16S rRNA (uracil1498-N3)-methyltransferase